MDNLDFNPDKQEFVYSRSATTRVMINNKIYTKTGMYACDLYDAKKQKTFLEDNKTKIKIVKSEDNCFHAYKRKVK